MAAYLFENSAYPIVTCEQDIVPALRDPFCRAVTLRDPALNFDSKKIVALPYPRLSKLYCPSKGSDRPKRKAGEIIYEREIKTADVCSEATAAFIVMGPRTIKEFTSRCNTYREIFSRVVSGYTGSQDVSLRGFALFTPTGGMGRAQELHVDSTILTFHWSAALASLSIANADPDETLWQALNKQKRKELDSKERALQLNLLRQAVKDPALDMRDNSVGDVIIAKGQYGRDLSDPEVRQSVCVHASSGAILANGQVGFLMTPTIN